MDFLYNGNLLEEERIDLVANEIVNKYVFISFEKAKEAAMLEGKITSNKTLTDELNRLYNIMLVNSDNKYIVKEIYKDYLELIKDNFYNVENEFILLSEKISDYFLFNKEFPYLYS